MQRMQQVQHMQLVQSMKQLRVVIAEDSKALRDLLDRRLSVIEGLNVVGAVANGIEAIKAVKDLEPHILILDISMPFKNGIEVLKELRQEDSSTVVIMLTDDPDLFTGRACLEA